MQGLVSKDKSGNSFVMINAFLNLKQNRTLPLLALLNWSAKLWSCSSKTHAGGHDMECVAGRGMR